MKVRACLLALACTFRVDATPILYTGDSEGRVQVTHVAIADNGPGASLTFVPDYVGPKRQGGLVFVVPAGVGVKDLHTLPPALLERVAALSAPRFVEYWEQDPCTASPRGTGDTSGPTPPEPEHAAAGKPPAVGDSRHSRTDPEQQSPGAADLQESIYSQPMVGPLADLEHWLRQHDQRLPQGAQSELERYAARGEQFAALLFDATRLPQYPSAIVLPPIGFSTMKPWRRVMARLGLVSVASPHDLYLHIFSATRVSVSSYRARPSPTNLLVDLVVRRYPGEFYGALYARVQQKFPGTFIEEYAWPALDCADPCPGEPLTVSSLKLLQGRDPQGSVEHFVHSRVHHRYDSQQLPRDIELEPVEGLMGGQGQPHGATAVLAATRRDAPANAFATRFVHTHRFQRPTPCPRPKRYRWGGPPRKPPGAIPVSIAKFTGVLSSQHIDLEQVVFSSVEELGLLGAEQPLLPRADAEPTVASVPDQSSRQAFRCSCSERSAPTPPAWCLTLLALLGGAGFLYRRLLRKHCPAPPQP